MNANPGVCVIGAQMHVPIDGHRRSATEILQNDGGAGGWETYVFRAHGKEYGVVVYFEYGGQSYEVYEDGERLGERQPNAEHYLELAQRICGKMGGTSLRRRL